MSSQSINMVVTKAKFANNRLRFLFITTKVIYATGLISLFTDLKK
jgi:hypothetical protein